MPLPDQTLADLLNGGKKGLLNLEIRTPPDFSKNTVARNNLSNLAKPVDEKLWPINEQWSDEDKKREALYLALHGLDWAQTRHISRNYDKGFHEQNPILGRNPSTDKVDAYMGLAALAHLFVADKLPPNLRKIFQNSLIGLEAGAVGNNEYRGIKAKF